MSLSQKSQGKKSLRDIERIIAEGLLEQREKWDKEESTALEKALQLSDPLPVNSHDDEESSLDDSDLIGEPHPGIEKLKLKNGWLPLVHEYLGDEFSTLIKDVHAPVDTTSFPELPGQKVVLHDHQKIGVTVLSRMCDGPFHGGILADSMGLGKTFTAVAFLQHRKASGVVGAFDMIVCHKNLMAQWEREIARFQDAEHAPRVLKIDKDPKGRVINLIRDHEFDIVLVSFHRVLHNWKRRDLFVESLEDIATEQDKNKQRERLSRLQHPILDFHSELYQLDKRNMIRHLVIDESHFIKNHEGQIHAAVRDLPARFVVQLTGTPFPNKWHNIYGLTELQHGQPCQKFEDWMHIFGQPPLKPGGQWRDPSTPQFERLIKFLQPLILARPATILSLPDLKHMTALYVINHDEMCQVAKLLHAFLKEIGKVSSLEGGVASQDFERAVMIATRAQQITSHPWLSRAITSEGRLIKRGSKITAEPLTEQVERFLNDIFRTSSIRVSTVFQDGEPQPHTNVSDMVWSITNMHAQPDTSEVAPIISSGSYSRPALDEPLHANEHVLSKTDGHGRVLWKKMLHNRPIDELNQGRVEVLVDTYRAIRHQYPDGKIIFFSTFLQLLDILEAVLQRTYDVFCFRFDGTVAAGPLRDNQLHSFSTCLDSARPLLMTKDAGSVGLNLTAASHVVLAEPWWTSTLERQAIARVHRQGQQQRVHVWHVTCQNSSFEVYIQHTRNTKGDFNDRVMERFIRPDSDEIQVAYVRPLFPYRR